MNSSELRRCLWLNAAPILLVVVACGQRYLAYAHNLTAWHGGGFGMFAELPKLETRRLSVTLVTPDDGEVRIPPFLLDSQILVADRMSRIRREILAMPTEGRLKALAHELADSEWIAVPESVGNSSLMVPYIGKYYSGKRDGSTVIPLAAVQVQVWEYQLDSETRRLVRRDLISVTAQTRRAGHGRHP